MQKHKGVNDLINKYKLNIMDLLKTKITSSKIRRVEKLLTLHYDNFSLMSQI
jgi:hypothetical protein